MKFTEKLDLLMARRNLTRGSLAEATGIPYNTIVGFYTKGYGNIKLSTLKKLSSYFGLTLDALADDGAPLDPVPAPEPGRLELLSPGGRKIVSGVIDGLLELEGARAEAAPAPVTWIREYLTPAAAGYANPALGEDYVEVPRGPEVPREADFACRIAGDSMEPYIADGARVYVSRRNQLEDGDVGIFFVDGDMKCKQYCEDAFGNIYLFSLNRRRKDADSLIAASSGVTVVCFGKVLMDRRPPLPRR